MSTRSLTINGKTLRVDPSSVRLDKRPLKSLEFLEAVADELTELTLSNAGLTSLRGLPSLPKLRKLNLFGNPLTDLTGLESAPQLEELCTGSAAVKKTGPLRALKSLRLLMIDVAEKDLRLLADTPALGYLSIRGPLRSLTGLEHAPKLGELLITGASLGKLTRLSHAVLWKLFINQSKLSRVPVLETPELLILALHDNAITDTSALKSLPKLRDIHLGKNALTHLSGLTGLPALEELDVELRRIKTIDTQTALALEARDCRVGRHTWKALPKKPKPV